VSGAIKSKQPYVNLKAAKKHPDLFQAELLAFSLSKIASAILVPQAHILEYQILQ
jgi:hypothetical protein